VAAPVSSSHCRPRACDYVSKFPLSRAGYDVRMEGPPQILPDPPLEPNRPGEPPEIQPQPPDPQEPWNDPVPPAPPLEPPAQPPQLPDE